MSKKRSYVAEEISKHLGNPYAFFSTLPENVQQYMIEHKNDEFHDERHKIHQMGVLFRKHIHKQGLKRFKRIVVVNGSSLLEWDAFGQLQWTITAYLCAISKEYGIPIYLIGYGKKNDNDVSKRIKKDQVERKFPEANIIKTWITEIRSQKKAFSEISDKSGLTYLMFILNGSLCRKPRNLQFIGEKFDKAIVDYMIHSKGIAIYSKESEYWERCNFKSFIELRKNRFPNTKLLDEWESENARHPRMYVIRTCLGL